MSECKHCDGTGEVEVKDGSVFECAECGGSGELPDHLVLEVEKTERGFGTIGFEDRYKQKCSLQESSLATEAAIWFGVDVDLNGNEVNQRMHLTQLQVQDLLPLLQRFAETGYLREQTPVVTEEVVDHFVEDCPRCGADSTLRPVVDPQDGHLLSYTLPRISPRMEGDPPRIGGHTIPMEELFTAWVCSACGHVCLSMDPDHVGRMTVDP